MVRLLCASNDYPAAEELATRTHDAAAAFHLARLYEAQDRVAEALRFYTISKRFSHGARLAMRWGLGMQMPRGTVSPEAW